MPKLASRLIRNHYETTLNAILKSGIDEASAEHGRAPAKA